MTHNRRAVVHGLAVTGVLVLSLAGCKKPAPPAGKQASTPSNAAAPAPATPEPDAVYIIRGKVAQIPDPKNPTTEFRVHHEPIPDFKNSEGKVVGMREMEMPFPVSDAKLLEGIQEGDLVEITFADWYKPIRSYKVTKLVKLPAGTKLNLKDE